MLNMSASHRPPSLHIRITTARGELTSPLLTFIQDRNLQSQHPSRRIPPHTRRNRLHRDLGRLERRRRRGDRQLVPRRHRRSGHARFTLRLSLPAFPPRGNAPFTPRALDHLDRVRPRHERDHHRLRRDAPSDRPSVLAQRHADARFPRASVFEAVGNVTCLYVVRLS